MCRSQQVKETNLTTFVRVLYGAESDKAIPQVISDSWMYSLDLIQKFKVVGSPLWLFCVSFVGYPQLLEHSHFLQINLPFAIQKMFS